MLMAAITLSQLSQIGAATLVIPSSISERETTYPVARLRDGAT